MGNHSIPEIRSHIHNGAHEQAAGTSTLCVQMSLGGVLLTNEVFSTIDEVVEGVFLLHQLSVLIPVSAHFLAAADMCQGEYKTTVQQTQSRSTKGGVHAITIRTVCI